MTSPTLKPTPIFSSGTARSAVFDAPGTMVISGNMVKVLAWYDNELGYSSRLADVTAMLAEKGW